MENALLEAEGTWSEIVANTVDFGDRPVRVIVLPLESKVVLPSPETVKSTRSISEQFADIRAKNPQEWENLPPDLAEQHDHYIYGLPKK